VTLPVNGFSTATLEAPLRPKLWSIQVAEKKRVTYSDTSEGAESLSTR